MIPGEKRIEDVISSRIKDFHAYYHRLKPQDGLPSKQSFDPTEVPRSLANLILLEMHENNRLFVRLVGETVFSRFGGDYSGNYIEDIDFGDVRPKVLLDYSTSVAEVRVLLSDHTFRSSKGNKYLVERSIFPFGEGRTITHMLTCFEFTEQPFEFERRPK